MKRTFRKLMSVKHGSADLALGFSLREITFLVNFGFQLYLGSSESSRRWVSAGEERPRAKPLSSPAGISL